jgi:hypothetical protein
MNALRKLRAAVVLGAIAMLGLGACAGSAYAHHPYANVYCRDRAVFGNTLYFYPTTAISVNRCRNDALLADVQLLLAKLRLSGDVVRCVRPPLRCVSK